MVQRAIWNWRNFFFFQRIKPSTATSAIRHHIMIIKW